MKSDISSSADTIDGHLPRIQQVPLVSASAQGKDRWMLKEKKRVFTFSLAPLPEQFFLPGQRLGILNQAEVNATEVHHENSQRRVNNEEAFQLITLYSLLLTLPHS